MTYCLTIRQSVSAVAVAVAVAVLHAAFTNAQDDQRSGDAVPALRWHSHVDFGCAPPPAIGQSFARGSTASRATGRRVGRAFRIWSIRHVTSRWLRRV
jgi:hypothetical protein